MIKTSYNYAPFIILYLEDKVVTLQSRVTMNDLSVIKCAKLRLYLYKETQLTKPPKLKKYEYFNQDSDGNGPIGKLIKSQLFRPQSFRRSIEPRAVVRKHSSCVGSENFAPLFFTDDRICIIIIFHRRITHMSVVLALFCIVE